MRHAQNKPFATIEDAQEYIALLAEAAAESKQDIAGELHLSSHRLSVERLKALRMVDYALEKLQRHLSTSGRILADLGSLRSLLIEDPKETHRVRIPPPDPVRRTISFPEP